MRGDNDTLLSRRTILTGIATSGIIGTSGCSALEAPPIEDVDITVAGIRSPSISLSKVGLPVVLDFINTSNSEIPDCSASFDALINSDPVATASTNVGTIAAGDSERTELNVVIDFGRVGEQVANALQQGVFTLVLDGDIEAQGMLPFASATREARAEYEMS